MAAALHPDVRDEFVTVGGGGFHYREWGDESARAVLLGAWSGMQDGPAAVTAAAPAGSRLLVDRLGRRRRIRPRSSKAPSGCGLHTQLESHAELGATLRAGPKLEAVGHL